MWDDLGTNGMDNSFEFFEFFSAPSGDADLSAADNSETLGFVGESALYAADHSSVLGNGLGHGTFPAALDTQLPREMMMQVAEEPAQYRLPQVYTQVPIAFPQQQLYSAAPVAPANGSVATGSSFAPAVPGIQGDHQNHQDPPTNGLHVVPIGVCEDPFADITLETINAFNGPFNPIFNTHRLLTTPMAPFGVPQASILMPTESTQQAAAPMMDWTNYSYEPTADHMMAPAAIPVDPMAYISPFHVPPAAAVTLRLENSSNVSACLGDPAYQSMVPRQMPVTNHIYQTPTGAQALNPDIAQQTNHHISAAPQPAPSFVPSPHALGNYDSSLTLNSSATHPAAKNSASKRKRQSVDEGDKGSSLQVTDEDGDTTACIIKNGKKIKVQLEDGEVVQEVQRVWTGCNECRRTKRKCNRLHVDKKEPCDRCIERGIPCVYSDKERVHASKGKKKSPEEAAAFRAKKEAQKIEDARLLAEGKSPRRKTKKNVQARMVIRSSPIKFKRASKKGKEREIEADTTSASYSDFSSPPASSFDEGSHFLSGDYSSSPNSLLDLPDMPPLTEEEQEANMDDMMAAALRDSRRERERYEGEGVASSSTETPPSSDGDVFAHGSSEGYQDGEELSDYTM
ncbi:hypothetical protein L198_02979 [Cryptococcus wingfieldii CBS 7118]|uniref:Zn(2)-C6 fungal-type domain-containing protein n=1 Tax=Cryptococcus wingfieldii CBS 7118 TaxID=1295528 RepID=A0A1E3JJ44_9TREE|nr:hypothetical protein L198_02979 [Cryptococcus wingfieldii CBS 7118]ODO00656.1 hypothetical protein L198_02979 [Cryptococcus wingfieldii CBS 7118]